MRFIDNQLLVKQNLSLQWQRASRLLTVVMLLGLSACSLSDQSAESAVDEQHSPEKLKAIAQSLLDETKLTEVSADIEEPSTALEQLSLAEKNSDYLRNKPLVMQAIPKAVKDLYQSAVAAMQQENFTQANQLFLQVIDLRPELAGSYLNLAIIAQKTQQLALADKYLAQALQANPLNPYAHNLKGLLARQRGDFDLAEKSYLQALKSLPTYADAHLNLAILSELYRGKLSLAQRHYQAYLSINKQDKQVERWLAGLTLKIGQTESGE
jgi:tetratricopeptide (TPR) repeat protein